MSRIDEALKRTAQERLEDPGLGLRGSPASTALGHAPILDRFVAEDASLRANVRPHESLPLIVEAHGAKPAHALPSLRSSTLVSHPDVEPVTVDQFRRLAAVLHDMQLETGLKTLLVSSAVPGEGKTLTVVNLALTLSESFRRRVLLIDADLRRPTLHDHLECPNKTGLADVLSNRGQTLPLVHVSQNLSLLTAGSRTSIPLAHLTSERMRNVIQDAAAHFDWVLIDTPPVGLLPDAQLVARISEGVLFVIAAGSTPYALVNRAIVAIGADRIVGTVLNRVNPRALKTASYNHAGYGNYYGADAKD
jgi:protein-tyrosine kinase